ncbi:hypothetical protein ACFQ1S_13820 [Kibdelosporangium lantanae]|uniref:Uncharacterized protein n=1 Tax=Kibdelosporangium lantanae TaxID=1497396 RepID=A0ABW3M7X5_9PSEU
MALTSSGVSIETVVHLAPGVPVRYEIDVVNQEVMLYFGAAEQYVLILTRDDLVQVMGLGAKAEAAFDQAG